MVRNGELAIGIVQSVMQCVSDLKMHVTSVEKQNRDYREGVQGIGTVLNVV